MGHWGCYSHNNDACHDILDRLSSSSFAKIVNPDAAMLERLLTHYCLPSKVDVDYDSPQELYLGIVMWGLYHNAVVARKRLQHALKCAKYLMNNKQYLERWKDSKARCE